jgi:hypothetical protein
VAEKKKKKTRNGLGPATVMKPALAGAGVLIVVQTAMKVFLHA